jgi:hypothetical protein
MPPRTSAFRRATMAALLVAAGCTDPVTVGYVDGEWQGDAGLEAQLAFTIERATLRSFRMYPQPLFDEWRCADPPAELASGDVHIPIRGDSFQVTLVSPTLTATLAGQLHQMSGYMFFAGGVTYSGSSCEGEFLSLTGPWRAEHK